MGFVWDVHYLQYTNEGAYKTWKIFFSEGHFIENMNEIAILLIDFWRFWSSGNLDVVL